MTTVATQDDALTRKRKTHRKSRLGCGNCKIRSVKCDEAKPTCRRCEASGYTCNYSRSAPTLQLAHSGVFKLDLTGESTHNTSWHISTRVPREQSLWPALRIPIASPLGGLTSEYELRPADYAALDRFQKRTVWTFGAACTRNWYSQAVSKLAKSHPFLFHIFLALSLLHDTHLSLPSSPSSRHSLAFHLYHATAIFKHLLARPSPSTSLSSSQRDALWVSASLLSTASFARTDNTHDLHSAWPLKRSEPDVDLDWLKMSHGKHVVWEIMDPRRPESIFNKMYNQDNVQGLPINGKAPIDPDILPPLFYSIFALSPTSSTETNPYHTPACVLSKLWNEQIDEHNILRFLNFMAQIDVRYRTLIEQKDPRAMLLLVYWHSMICFHDAWWLRRRSVVEGMAMCIYLEEHCADDRDIMELLQSPKARLTMAFQRGNLVYHG